MVGVYSPSLSPWLALTSYGLQHDMPATKPRLGDGEVAGGRPAVNTTRFADWSVMAGLLESAEVPIVMAAVGL